MMSTSAITVTVIITVACQFTVRQTCVCAAFPIGPVSGRRSMLFHQSQNPGEGGAERHDEARDDDVGGRDERVPRRARVGPLGDEGDRRRTRRPARRRRSGSRSAAGVWACRPPRIPRNFLPVNVTAGFVENSRAIVASLSCVSSVPVRCSI